MNYQQRIASAVAAMFAWVVPANAAPPEPGDEIANVIGEPADDVPRPTQGGC